MNVLAYTTSDIKIEMSVEKSKFDYRQELPSHTITKTGGKIQMQSAPTRLRLDTYERRASMGQRGLSAQTTYMKQSGRQAALEAIANYAQRGDALKNIQKGANIPAAYQAAMQNSGTLGFTNLAPVEISWEKGFLRQDYETARLAYDWKTQRGTMQYTPAKVSFNVTQYPSISFNYTGPPIYVPKSSDPNYSEAI